MYTIVDKYLIDPKSFSLSLWISPVYWTLHVTQHIVRSGPKRYTQDCIESDVAALRGGLVISLSVFNHRTGAK